ncbi:MAG: FAD-binding domain-containing protein [Pseudomonadota bacterium]
MSVPFVFQPTRAAGLEQLARFLPHAGDYYSRQRNYDRGPQGRDNTSGLSPWLRHRLLTETEVLKAVLARHGRASADRFISEVFWGTYFRGWLEQRPSVRSAFVEGRDDALGASGTDYAAALAGRTGIDCFDAWVQELIVTGYLHNHARMWFASIWIFTLRLPWELGADFFLRHLIDGDPAVNTLSWRWVAGLHTAGKCYVASADNIARFTEGLFCPRGLATQAAPLREDREHPRVPLLDANAPPLEPFVSLLTSADLTAPDTRDMAPAISIVLGLPEHGDTPTTRFRSGALADTAERQGARLALTDDWAGVVLDAVANCGLRCVAMPFAPVGNVRSRLDEMATRLGAAGLDVRRLRRTYDSVAWPHARAGYFGMKKKIPEILDALGLHAGG